MVRKDAVCRVRLLYLRLVLLYVFGGAMAGLDIPRIVPPQLALYAEEGIIHLGRQ